MDGDYEAVDAFKLLQYTVFEWSRSLGLFQADVMGEDPVPVFEVELGP